MAAACKLQNRAACSDAHCCLENLDPTLLKSWLNRSSKQQCRWQRTSPAPPALAPPALLHPRHPPHLRCPPLLQLRAALLQMLPAPPRPAVWNGREGSGLGHLTGWQQASSAAAGGSIKPDSINAGRSGLSPHARSFPELRQASRQPALAATGQRGAPLLPRPSTPPCPSAPHLSQQFNRVGSGGCCQRGLQGCCSRQRRLVIVLNDRPLRQLRRRACRRGTGSRKGDRSDQEQAGAATACNAAAASSGTNHFRNPTTHLSWAGPGCSCRRRTPPAPAAPR